MTTPVTAGVTVEVAAPATRPLAVVPPEPEAERTPGGIETAVQAYIESLHYRDGDPRALLAQIAVRLAQRVDDTGALPAAVRELRVMLLQLAEVPGEDHGPLDKHRAQRAARRVIGLLAG